MARRLILDTGLLIESERGGARLAASISSEDDLAIAAITVAELRLGVELAAEQHRERRAAYVHELLARLPVIVYDTGIAEVHARLLAAVRRAGQPRGSYDLVIAATAAATNRTILTTDRKAKFDRLDGVSCLLV